MKMTDDYKAGNTHPGKLLADRLIGMGMSIKEFAVRTSKPEKTIIAVMKGDSSITPDMAVAFENVTMTPADIWMNAQRLYDEHQARLRREETMRLSEGWMMKFPVDEMVEKGWTGRFQSVEEKVDGLFSFFGISTEKAWWDYYLNQGLKIAFSISLSNIKNPYAVSAWLRYGELKASGVKLDSLYSDKRLREYLPLMKAVMANERDGWYEELQELCGNVGIKLIYVPCLKDVPVTGVTRWINDVPVIQLSDKYKRYDEFWRLFFHEVGHILLHGKKDIFVEGIECCDMNKEREAEKFSDDRILPKADERRILSRGDFSPESICEMAEFMGTHPSVIVGRLQQRGVISCYDYKFMKNIEL